MDVFPQDLGTRRHVALIADRATAMNGAGRGGHLRSLIAGRGSGAAPRLGALGRFWTRGSGMDPASAREALGAMRPQIIGMVGGMVGGSIGFVTPAIVMASTGEPMGAVIMGAMGLAMTTLGLSLPRVIFRRLHGSPLGENEIEALIPQASDDLERAYLCLARDIVRQRVPDAAEKDVRSALRALGEAIDRLPAFSAAGLDVDALRRGADEARLQSETETDSVIAASRERRAEALERSADAAKRSALLMRRAAALRDEMIAQTEALRLGLAAFDTGATDIGALAQLAASVRGVAAEAASVGDARAELDAVVTTTDTPPVPLRVGQMR